MDTIVISSLCIRIRAERKELKMPRKMRLSDIDEVFRLLSQTNPDPQTELTFTNPYTLLVAVVLSAQATDVGVNKATKGLFAAADTPEAMVGLGLESVRAMAIWEDDWPV